MSQCWVLGIRGKPKAHLAKNSLSCSHLQRREPLAGAFPRACSYANFNHAARKLSVRLSQLGAKELCPRGLADEQSGSGLEGDVDEWTSKTLWPATLEHAFGAGATVPEGVDAPRCLATRYRVRKTVLTASATPSPAASSSLAAPHCVMASEDATFLASVAPANAYCTAADGPATGLAAHPPASLCPPATTPSTKLARCIAVPKARGAMLCPVVSNVRLTKPEWAQETRHVTLSIEGSGSAFRAGDVCCVMPRNDSTPENLAALQGMAVRLGLGWEEVVELTVGEPALHGAMLSPALQAGSAAALAMARAHQAQTRSSASSASSASSCEALVGQGAVPPWPPGQVFAGTARPLHPTTALPAHVTVAELLGGYLDVLGTPRRAAFEQLSFFATDEEEADKLREISAPGGGDLYCTYAERERRTWAEVLDDFPSCLVPLPHLLELVPALRPREFSVASSPALRPGVVELCVAVLAFSTPFGRSKRGLGSSHLAGVTECAGMADPPRVTAWLRPGTLPPLPLDSPCVLVGPGTGVAPLRALLHERAARLARRSPPAQPSPAERAVVATPAGFWPALPGSAAGGGTSSTASADSLKADDACFPRLYFGSRHRCFDFYFAEEWHNMVRMGWLGALRTAFSRDGGPDAGEDGKVYVQARMLQDADCLAAALGDPECRVVICGSAKRMPSDVADVLQTVLQAKMAMSEAEARAYLQRMQHSGRYHVEAWS